MGFSLKRIWQAYAFEHPQFWQRIDAPVYITSFSARHPLNTVCNRHPNTGCMQSCGYCHVEDIDAAVRCSCSCFQLHSDGSSSSSSASSSPLPPCRVGVTSLPVVRGRVCCIADMLMLHADVSSPRSIVGVHVHNMASVSVKFRPLFRMYSGWGCNGRAGGPLFSSSLPSLPFPLFPSPPLEKGPLKSS